MAHNTSISLSDHFKNIIDKSIESGRFDSASEVLREGLRLLEEREQRLEAVRAALIEGENSGEPTDFDFDAFLERKNAEKAA